MNDFKKALNKLADDIHAAAKQIKLDELELELETLQKKQSEKSFWSDPSLAQQTMQRLSRLESRLKPWQKLKKDTKELAELAEIGDSSMQNDLSDQYKIIKKSFDELKSELAYSGPYDDHDVILRVFAGAGGTDAQDWTQMLMRMYSRWAEKHKIKVRLIEETTGDEAGIKNATLELNGQFLYGKLKGEQGVHRLVRLSPYNADNLRQTSFAKVEILPKIDEPAELDIDDQDLKIDVFRAGGHGGQSVNTTDSAVRVTHLPTGITVSIQNERSQLQNKQTALTVLRSRLIQLQLEQHQTALKEVKGPIQSAEWGNQIRSYVLHPYKQVKDLRTHYESKNPEKILDGDLDGLIQAYQEKNISTFAP